MRMLADDGKRDVRLMVDALRRLPEQSLPSEMIVPGLLDGFENVGRLVNRWLPERFAGRRAASPIATKRLRHVSIRAAGPAGDRRTEPCPTRTRLAHRLGVVLKGWPRLSETFIAQELRALERRGLRLRLFSLRHPTDRRVHALNRARRGTGRLPAGISVARAAARLARLARRAPPARLPRRARATGSPISRRDPTPNRVAPLRPGAGPGRRAAGADIGHLHAHFLHTPASVRAMLR